MAGTATNKANIAPRESTVRQVIIEHQRVVDDLETLRAAGPGALLVGSKTWDPVSLTTGTQATTTVTVTGAVLGDFAEASFSLDLQATTLSAYVSAADTVTVVHKNGTAGTLDLASGTLRVRVRPTATNVAVAAAALTAAYINGENGNKITE